MNDCYIGRLPCGCAVAWVNNDKSNPKMVSEALSEWIRKGYSVEPAELDKIRPQLGPCKCHKRFDYERGETNGQLIT